jgi:hypothetical protein
LEGGGFRRFGLVGRPFSTGRGHGIQNTLNVQREDASTGRLHTISTNGKTRTDSGKILVTTGEYEALNV